LQQLVTERGSTATDLNGIRPVGAARLLADAGDIHRFRDQNRFASWNGTAPLDASSGQQQRHRLSRAANRKINDLDSRRCTSILRSRWSGSHRTDLARRRERVSNLNLKRREAYAYLLE
jgi:transposase